jgi:hypothetical protein
MLFAPSAVAREIQRREIVQLREQVALERGLKDLREQVENAKSEVPKIPLITQQMEENRARLYGEIGKIKDKLGKLRVDQSVADFKLNELRMADPECVEMQSET